MLRLGLPNVILNLEGHYWQINSPFWNFPSPENLADRPLIFLNDFALLHIYEDDTTSIVVADTGIQGDVEWCHTLSCTK